eukprot:2641848-Pyramimonas_sp.AAC.1
MGNRQATLRNWFTNHHTNRPEAISLLFLHVPPAEGHARPRPSAEAPCHHGLRRAAVQVE